MLQIISGKFFDESKVNEEKNYAVLYSNYSIIFEIDTDIVKLIPDKFNKSNVKLYVMEFMNRYQPKENDILVLPINTPIVEQFKFLSSFWFQALFHEDKAYIESKCRKTPSHTSDYFVPSDFITRIFDSSIDGNIKDIEEFRDFFQKVILLPREKYNLFISLIRTYYNALEAFETNFELSYSMFVYILETLVFDSYDYNPTWEDYDINLKSKYNNLFESIDVSIVSQLKDLLVKDKFFKLQARFINGILGYLDDEFYTCESSGNNIPKSEIRRVLKNLYSTRSKYVHELKEMHKQLKTPGFLTARGDCLEWENEPYFTISGLIRLTRYVLFNFLDKQEQYDKEDYEWRKELPGIINVKLAPECWIWQHENFSPNDSINYFNGFISMIFSAFSANNPIVEMNELLEKVEELLGQANDESKLAMLSIYILYNSLLKKEERMRNHEKIYRKYEMLLDKCTIYCLVMYVFYDYSLPWEADLCESVFDKYKKSKYKKGRVNLPLRIELAIIFKISNKYLEENNIDKYNELLNIIYLDSSGNTKIIEFINNLRSTQVKGNSLEILKL